MVMNLEYFHTTAAKLKCILMLMIAIIVGIGATGYFSSDYNVNRDKVIEIINNKKVNLWQEICFITVILLAFGCSVINLLIHLTSQHIYYNPLTAIIDFVYHGLLGVALFTSGGINIVSAVRIFGINCTSENECQVFEIKLAAGILSILSSLLCGAVATVVLTNRKDVERDGLLVY